MNKPATKIFYLSSFALWALFSKFAAAANLKDALTITEKTAGNTYKTDRDIYPILGDIIAVILSLIGIIFIIFIIYAGYLWLTASGNDQKVDKAKSILKQSIIGVAIVVGAYAISYFFIQIISPQLKIQ